MQTSIAVPARDLGEALRASVAGALNAFLLAIPRLIGFGLVLVVGWVVSSLLARGVRALLHAIRFNDLARRSGFADFVQKMGVRRDASSAIAGIVKWFIRLIALVVAFDFLGLPAVSIVLQRLLLWLPNLVVALVVVVIGGLAAKTLSRLVRGSSAESGLGNPDVLAAVTRIAVWSFTLLVAVSQLGIATNVIDALVAGVVGALALATGLAFGLGGRDQAARILDRLGERAELAGPRLQQARASAREPTRPALEGARNAEFDESWIPRSGKDRRRVARPGIDRRRTASA
jgi:mechanosensitive ion channel-like protein